jgi:hypothetical protein
LQIAAEQPWSNTVLVGTENLFHSIGSHLGALAVIFVIVAGRRMLTPLPQFRLPDAARVIANALLAMFGMLLAGIVFGKVTGFKDRWLMPLCVWAPILLLALFSSQLDAGRLHFLARLATSIALLVAILIPLRVWFGQAFALTQTLNAPYAELIQELPPEATNLPLVITDDNWVGGNLKRYLPEHFVASPKIYLDHPISKGTECLLVWNATKNETGRDRLFAVIGPLARIRTNDFRYVSAPLNYWSGKKMTIGFTTCQFILSSSTALRRVSPPAK